MLRRNVAAGCSVLMATIRLSWMKIRHCVACVRYVHWTLKVGGKVIFEDGEVLPQRWDIGWGRVVNCVEIKDGKGSGEFDEFRCSGVGSY